MINFFTTIFKKIKMFLTKAKGEFLCDSCRYDYPNACNNPNRPNVKSCDEYKPR
jgi:hypothetical protein